MKQANRLPAGIEVKCKAGFAATADGLVVHSGECLAKVRAFPQSLIADDHINIGGNRIDPDSSGGSVGADLLVVLLQLGNNAVGDDDPLPFVREPKGLEWPALESKLR